VGGGHPSGAEGGLGVKTGAAGAPFRARGEGLGQLPDRARRHRGNQNLVARELGDLPRAEVEGRRGRDGPAARAVHGNMRGALSWGRGEGRWRRAARHAGRGGDAGGGEGLGHGLSDPVACLLCSGNGSPFSSCPVPALLSLLGSEAERIWNQDAEEQIASSNFITEYVITRL